MFSKVLTVWALLCAVQVYGGSIKPQLSAQVQEVVEKIDIAALLIENELKMAAVDKKHNQDLVKQNTKMAIKQLKQAVKESKGTNVLCGEIASLEVRTVEKRADDVKLCTNKLDMKELQRDLNGYLKSLHNEALLVDKYCPFMQSNAEEAAQCVTDSVTALEAKLNDVETVIKIGLAGHLEDSSACLKSVVEDVQMESARIQIELADCLNPTTAAPKATEDPAQDGSSESKESESSESKESNEGESGTSEVSKAPAGDENEGDDKGNSSGVDNNEEQISEGSDNGEGGNGDKNTTNGKGGDANNDETVTEDCSTKEEKPVEDENTSEDVPVEKNKPTKDTPVEEEKPIVDVPAEEAKPAEDTPVENIPAEEIKPTEDAPAENNNPVENGKPEKSSEIKDNDEINIEY